MQGVRRTALLAGAAQPPVLADAFAAAFLALAALPPVLANTDAAAAALLALGAQPPVLVHLLGGRPRGHMQRAANQTSSQSKQKADFRSQRSSGTGMKKEGRPQISVPAFDFCRSALQISVKRSRFQIVQITSHMLCPGEKQKSAAAFAFWIQQIAEKKNPRFVETCTFRILVAYADPNVALPDFCRAERMMSRSLGQPKPGENCKRRQLSLDRFLQQMAVRQKSRFTESKKLVQIPMLSEISSRNPRGAQKNRGQISHRNMLSPSMPVP